MSISRSLAPRLAAPFSRRGRGRGRRGFTLLELTIVLLLVGILSSMAIYIYGKMVNKARMSQAPIVLNHLQKTETIYYSDASRYTDNTLIIDYDPVKYDYYKVTVTVDNTGQNFTGVATGIGPMAGDVWQITKDGAPVHVSDNAFINR
ncbi:MAG: prepilin-type N-terminal cleavage/methylation domain-containing protein [bacterium]|nr:prepilin-type N-terminal cleavage/methylation domain-containing protein [bacterium]